MRAWAALVAIVLALVVMVPATVTTGAAMFNPKIGSEQVDALGFIFHSHLTANDLQWKDRYPQILALDSYFAGTSPTGTSLLTTSRCVSPTLLTTISQPKLFVIPNDRDFQRILADPITFHTHYILEANPAQFPNTSINIQYPNLWNTGAGFTQLVRKFPSQATCPAYPSLSGAPSFRGRGIVGPTAQDPHSGPADQSAVNCPWISRSSTRSRPATRQLSVAGFHSAVLATRSTHPSR